MLLQLFDENENNTTLFLQQINWEALFVPWIKFSKYLSKFQTHNEENFFFEFKYI